MKTKTSTDDHGAVEAASSKGLGRTHTGQNSLGGGVLRGPGESVSLFIC